MIWWWPKGERARRIEIYQRWLFSSSVDGWQVYWWYKEEEDRMRNHYMKGLLHVQVEITKVFHIKKFSLFLEFYPSEEKDKLNYPFSSPSSYYISPSTHCLSQHCLFWSQYASLFNGFCQLKVRNRRNSRFSYLQYLWH